MKRFFTALVSSAAILGGAMTYSLHGALPSPAAGNLPDQTYGAQPEATGYEGESLLLAGLPRIISRPAPAAQPAEPFQGGFAQPLINPQEVPFEKLPPTVQQTVRTQATPERITHIARGMLEGRTTYQIAFTDPQGQPALLRVDERGAFLGRALGEQATATPDRDRRDWGGFELPLSDGVKVSIDQVPAAAQKAIRAHAGDARIEDIVRGELLGMTAYQAAFKPDGMHHELRVAEDGTFLEQSADGRVIAQAPLLQNRLSYLANLPRPVQSAIHQQAERGLIRTIQEQVREGQQVYHVAVERDQTRQEFVISRDGQLVQPPTGQPPAGQPADRDPRLWGGFERPLSDGVKVSMEKVPAAAQKTIRAHAGDARIEDIVRGGILGTTAYQAAFKLKDVHHELRVTEGGAFLEQSADGEVIAQSRLLQNRMAYLGHLPRPVQNAIQEQAGDAMIRVIQEQMREGQPVYHVVVEQERMRSEFVVSRQGELVQAPAVREPAGTGRTFRLPRPQ